MLWLFFIVECGIMRFFCAMCVFKVRASSSSPRLPFATFIAELAHGEKLHTHSLTHPAYLMPQELKHILRNKISFLSTCPAICAIIARLYLACVFLPSSFTFSKTDAFVTSSFQLILEFFSRSKPRRLLTVSCLLLWESKSLLHTVPHSRQSIWQLSSVSLDLNCLRRLHLQNI